MTDFILSQARCHICASFSRRPRAEIKEIRVSVALNARLTSLTSVALDGTHYKCRFYEMSQTQRRQTGEKGDATFCFFFPLSFTVPQFWRNRVINIVCFFLRRLGFLVPFRSSQRTLSMIPSLCAAHGRRIKRRAYHQLFATRRCRSRLVMILGFYFSSGGLLVLYLKLHWGRRPLCLPLSAGSTSETLQV